MTLAIVAWFSFRWSHGWLLLLDWAPGPASGTLPGPELPVGPALSAFAAAIADLAPQLVGWVLPAGAVAASCAGGAVLARTWRRSDGRRLSWTAATVGGVVAATNPFVAARVASGQIGVLWGYALLWWLVASIVDGVDRRDVASWLVPGCWLGAATACTTHMAVVGAVPVILAGGLAHRRWGGRVAATRVLRTLGLGYAITAVWLVPVLAVGRGLLGEPGGRDAVLTFASGGPVATLWARALGGAAFWRQLPEGSLTGFGIIVAGAWLTTVVSWRFGRGQSRDLRHLLLACSVVAVVAVHVSRGPLLGPWVLAVENFWPAGLLREPGKMLMLAVLAPVCGVAAGAQVLLDRIETRTRSSQVRRKISSGAFAGTLLVACSPWLGLVDWLEPSDYPADWDAIAEIVAVDDCPIAVLGAGAYLDPGFTGGRVVAHPAQGYFGAQAIVSTESGIRGLGPRPPADATHRWVAAHDTVTRPENSAVPTAASASAAGIGWVFVHRPVDHPDLVDRLRRGGFDSVRSGGDAAIWRAPEGCR